MIISESKKENYCTEISNGNTAFFSDVAEEKGGKGQYLRPHYLLCGGFASCLNIATRMVLEPCRFPLNPDRIPEVGGISKKLKIEQKLGLRAKPQLYFHAPSSRDKEKRNLKKK